MENITDKIGRARVKSDRECLSTDAVSVNISSNRVYVMNRKNLRLTIYTLGLDQCPDDSKDLSSSLFIAVCD